MYGHVFVTTPPKEESSSSNGQRSEEHGQAEYGQRGDWHRGDHEPWYNEYKEMNARVSRWCDTQGVDEKARAMLFTKPLWFQMKIIAYPLEARKNPSALLCSRIVELTRKHRGKGHRV